MRPSTRILVALAVLAALTALAVIVILTRGRDPAGEAAPVPPPPTAAPTPVEQLLEQHARFLGGRNAIAAAGDFVVEATVAGPRPQRLRTFVQRRPFGFRRERESHGSSEREVEVSNGRHAWRLLPDGQSELLIGEPARLVLEAAWIDGLRYLEPSGPYARPALGPVEMLVMPQGAPQMLKSGIPVLPVAVTLPCDGELRLFFDITDGHCWGLANPGIAPQRNVRYGECRQFGSLQFPASRWENRGRDPFVRVQIEAVRFEPLSPALFAGNPMPKAEALLDAGPIERLPMEIPGACYFVLPLVTMNARAKGPALFDTGAARIYLDTQLADLLALPVLSPRGSLGVTGRAAGTRRWLDTLGLPGLRLAQIEVSTTSIPATAQTAEGQWPALALGGEVLMMGPVLDLRQGRLLLRGAGCEPMRGDGVFTVPLSRDLFRDLDTLPIDIGGHALDAVLDSGLPAVLRLTTRGLLQAGLRVDAATWLARGAVPLGTSGAGRGSATDLVAQLDSFRLGPVTFERPWVMLDLAPEGKGTFCDASLGAGALAVFARIGIDRDRRRLELAPGAGLQRDGDGWRAPTAGTFLGLRAQLPDATARAAGEALPVVVEVAAGSPATAASLVPGDRLVAVGGTPFAGLDLRLWKEKLWAPSGSVAVEVRKADGRVLRLSLARGN